MMYDGKPVEYEATKDSIQDYLALLHNMSVAGELSQVQTTDLVEMLSMWNRRFKLEVDIR